MRHLLTSILRDLELSGRDCAGHSVRGALRTPRQRAGDRPERMARVAVEWSAGHTEGSRSVRSRWVRSLVAACRRALRSRGGMRRSRIRAAGAGSAAAPSWPVPGFTVARRMVMTYGARRHMLLGW